MVCDGKISDPLKKFEVQTFNSVIDLSLFKWKNHFDSRNISPLKICLYFQEEGFMK